MSFAKKTIGIIGAIFFIVFIAAIGTASDKKISEIDFSPTSQVESIVAQALETTNPTPIDPNVSFAKVVVVIDGDTIEIEGGSKVRLIGVDTPETVDPSRPVGCYGKEASSFTRSQLEGKEVKLEKDISETDRYGRLLRYVWLGDTLFNEKLVKEGFAQSSTYPPDVKYQDKFVSAQSEARGSQKGLWGATCKSAPKSTSTPKSSVPATTSTGSCKYSCSSPDRDCSDFTTHTEAQAFFNCCGFSASNDPMRLDKATGQGNGLACESLP